MEDFWEDLLVTLLGVAAAKALDLAIEVLKEKTPGQDKREES